MIVVDRPVENMQIHEHLQYGQQKENIELRILLKENTALLSTVRPSVSVQAWHLNFSQLFDDLGHENHVFSESV